MKLELAGKYPTRDIENDKNSMSFTVRGRCVLVHADLTGGRSSYYEKDYSLSEEEYSELVCGCLRRDELVFFKYPSYGPLCESITDFVELLKPLFPGITSMTVYNGVVI